MLSRSSINLAARSLRVSPARAFSMTAAARADEGPSSAGATASSKGFSNREKAAENQYILERERENYKKAQELLKKQKEDLDKLEKDSSAEQK